MSYFDGFPMDCPLEIYFPKYISTVLQMSQMHKCNGMTLTGEPCQISVSCSKGYCHHHRQQDSDESTTAVPSRSQATAVPSRRRSTRLAASITPLAPTSPTLSPLFRIRHLVLQYRL